MGLFWDLIQHNQIRETREHSANLEERVAWLERELSETNRVVAVMLQRLEQKFGEDLDNDGRIG